MSWFERKADAPEQPTVTSAPESKDTSLRDTLRDKLKQLAEAGNVSAIKELLDRPALLDPELPTLTSVEDVMAYMHHEHEQATRELLKRCSREMAFAASQRAMRELLDTCKQRALAANPNYVRDAFCSAVRQRLEDEAKHELVRRWDGISQSLKDELWDTIIECLSEEGGADGVLEKNQAVIQ